MAEIPNESLLQPRGVDDHVRNRVKALMLMTPMLPGGRRADLTEIKCSFLKVHIVRT